MKAILNTTGFIPFLPFHCDLQIIHYLHMCCEKTELWCAARFDIFEGPVWVGSIKFPNLFFLSLATVDQILQLKQKDHVMDKGANSYFDCPQVMCLMQQGS